MNIPEIDLTSMINETGKESNINLVEKISEEQVKAKEFVSNYSNESYKKYLNLIENYFNEKKSKKYNQKFKYYVDDESRFVKEAIDKSDEKNNMIINVPKYVNIDLKLKQLRSLINTNETKLRFIRSSLLNGNKSQSSEFDKIKNELFSQMKDKNILVEAKKIIDNADSINISQDEIDEILNKKIQQNNNYVSISELIEDKKINEDLKFLVKNYIQNNLEIMKYQEKIRTLKSTIPNENLVEVLPTNEKKKIKFKPRSKKSKKVAGLKLEDALPETIQIPKLEGYKDLDLEPFEDVEKNELDNGEQGEPKEVQPLNLVQDLENKEVNLVDNLENKNENEREINLENPQNELNFDDDLESNEVDLFSNIDSSITQQNSNDSDEQVNLLPGEELEISALPDLSGELDDLSDYESDYEEDIAQTNVKFNSPESIKEKTEELKRDAELPLFSESSDNNKNPQQNESAIDINKLSRDLNKKVSDEIKIVKIKMNPEDSNIQFDKIKGKNKK
jgi:hypothetical protein